MIIGIGTDIIEIDRIKRAVDRTNGFIEKIFTDKEITLFKSKNMRLEVIAGNFAAKEAISKSLGTGIRGFSLKEIEVLRDDLGKPIVFLSDNIEKLIGKGYKLNLSISHNNTSAIAFAILEES
ncbi:4'-phosphopantetheinyl transferase [Clostridium sartagoforme AAU1]|jgi:holo-[acyl-carrier protein] synthase|uniref:Holo-[acyl-carrier-protein] synthase n=1 Tax=Clostridium sartagoforme AAU1 TaxID=1202534 RepID=R9C781_9CLOT|nr:holo-ACP synthase [Clostridium sartagoforme]EOR25224.1 4'-phosphopantetheinyl transferase [Clostridium sartagoforme AAU1]